MPAPLILYYRVGCGLCEDFERELRQYLSGKQYDLQTVDIDSDPLLVQQYGVKVPVLAGGQGELCHYELDRIALDNYLSAGQNPLTYAPN